MSAVVLLHGSASSGAQWRTLGERLAPRFNVIAPDLHGYGAGPAWHGHGAFRLAHESALVLAEIERVGEPVHLVGHSYGGAVALDIARRRVGLVRSLTLIEPVAFYLLRHGDATDAAGWREISEVAAELERALVRGDYERGCSRFVDYWNGPGAWEAMPAARREALVPRLAKIVLDFHATLAEDASPADLGMVAAETLLVQGAATVLPVRRICRLLASAMSRAWLETVAGAGHMLPLTHRDEVDPIVEGFLHLNEPEEDSHVRSEHRRRLSDHPRRGLRDRAGARAHSPGAGLAAARREPGA